MFQSARLAANFGRAVRVGGAIIALLLVLVACSAAPVPIAYGQDSCDYCRMQISDPRYGGELITRTGKVLKFDSIECLASYYGGLADRATIRSTWVSDYEHPSTLIPADAAIYLRHSGPGSPMGRGLLAVAGGADAAALAARLGGDMLSWSDVVTLVARDALRPGADRGGDGGSGSGSGGDSVGDSGSDSGGDSGGDGGGDTATNSTTYTDTAARAHTH